MDETALAAPYVGFIGGRWDVPGEPAINPALLSAPNTVLLPHLGSATVKRELRWAWVVENARVFLRVIA